MMSSQTRDKRGKSHSLSERVATTMMGFITLSIIIQTTQQCDPAKQNIYLGSTVTLPNFLSLSQDDTINATLEAIRQILPVEDYYTFTTPQIQMECSCVQEDNLVEYLHENANDEFYFKKFTNKNGTAICHPNIQPNEGTKYKTAIKIDQRFNEILYDLKLQYGPDEKTITIPRNIKKIYIKKLGAVIQLEEENPESNPFLKHDWCYAKIGSKNLRTDVPVNEIDEYNVQKLGWYKRTNQGIFTYDKKKFLEKFNVIDYNCNQLDFQYQLNVVHYYNSKRLLLNEIIGTPIQELIKLPIDDINIEKKTINISYKRPPSSSLRISIPDWRDCFYFKASICSDEYDNSFLVVEIKEKFVGIIAVQFIEMSIYRKQFYHNGQKKVYFLHLFAEVRNDNWICMYPWSNPSRVTCQFVDYIGKCWLNQKFYKPVDYIKGMELETFLRKWNKKKA